MKKILLLLIAISFVSCGILEDIKEMEKHDYPGGEGCTLRVFDLRDLSWTNYCHTSMEEFLYEHPFANPLRYKFKETCE